MKENYSSPTIQVHIPNALIYIYFYIHFLLIYPNSRTHIFDVINYQKLTIRLIQFPVRWVRKGALSGRRTIRKRE